MPKQTKPRTRRPRSPADWSRHMLTCLVVLSAVSAVETRIAAQVRALGYNFAVDISLQGTIDGVASNDGSRVYVPAFLRDAVVVFQRDLRTGLLSPIEAASHQLGGNNIIDGPVHLELTASGEDLYVASLEGNNITHWARSSSGVDFGSVAPGPAGQVGIAGPAALTLNRDETELWAVGLSDDRLFVYPRGADGTLGVPTTLTLASGARDIVFSADGDFAYIADFDGDALIVVENASSGPIERQRLTTGAIGVSLDGPYDISVSPDGNDVYLAEFIGGAVHHFSRLSSGLLAHQNRLSSADVATLTGAFSVHVTQDGSQVLVSGGMQPGTVHAFSRASDGSLSLQQVLDSTSTMAGALEHPAGLWQAGSSIYWSDLASGSVAHARLTDDGLSPSEVQSNGSPFGHRIAATENPQLLYSFYRSDTSQELAYQRVHRNPATGGLSASAGSTLPVPILQSPDGLATSQDHKDAYLAFFEDQLIQVDLRDSTPQLGDTFDATVSGLDGPLQIAIAPDDRHVYVTTFHSRSIIHFERDLVTGSLTPRGSTVLGQYPRSLELSLDGTHLYAMTKGEIVTYQRDPTTGTLIFLSSIDTTNSDPSNTNTAQSLSADGRHLYVSVLMSSVNRAQLKAYSRALPQGSLTLLQTLTGTTVSAVGDIQLIHNDTRLLVADSVAPTTTTYTRDPLTGLLALESPEGVWPDNWPLWAGGSFIKSTDGLHLYSLGYRGTVTLSLEGVFHNNFESGDTSHWN